MTLTRFARLLGGLRRQLRRGAADERGAVAALFAVSSFALLTLLGATLDYTMMARLRTSLQTASDGTALVLCKADPTLTQAALNSLATSTLAGYMPTATVDAPVVSGPPRTISVTTHATYIPYFARLVGVNTFPMSVAAQCSVGERYFEIALVLDNSTSMDASSGSTSKMEALRQAATDFINFLYVSSNLTNYVKVAIVPFTAAVAVDPATAATADWVDLGGQSAFHWQNVLGAPAAGFSNRLGIFTKLAGTRAAWAWAGCFESLPYPLNVQDGKPSPSNPDSYYVPMLAPDEAGNGGTVWHVETSTGAYQSTPNSYLNDATSAATCNTTPQDDLTRQGRACKYVNPTGATWTNSLGPNWMCRSRPLTRLTNDKNKLLSEIQLMQANGNTNIHEGFMWGWRAVSPNSVFGDGTSYTDKTRVKIIVLMTDGMNTWTTNSSNSVVKSYYSAYGYYQNIDGTKPNGRLPAGNANPANDTQARAAMDQLLREACRNASGPDPANPDPIIIYTVGLSVSSDPIDANGLQLLRDCAGLQSRSFVANNATSLIAAFRTIAGGIRELRLSQ
jgi:Flp pilus assembly protein TadG